MEEEQAKIGIVGSGLIGRSWAMLYASVGHKCWIYDIKPEQVKSALNDIEHQLRCLEQSGLLRGKLNARQQMLCITGTTSLEEAVRGAMLIQECIPENLDLKKKLFNTIDGLLDHSTIIATSTSAFLPSVLSEGLRHKKNFIVLHPVNPPYYVPLVEIIPAPWTSATVVDKTREMMGSIGQTPVCLSKEIPGFALNRIQYAVLTETFNLVKDGILNAHDVDKVMNDGLGMRYAAVGTLETTHLNADGFRQYCDKYANTINTVCNDMKELPKFTRTMVSEIADQLEAEIPLEEIQRRRDWRDLFLIRLWQLKKEMESLK